MLPKNPCCEKSALSKKGLAHPANWNMRFPVFSIPAFLIRRTERGGVLAPGITGAGLSDGRHAKAVAPAYPRDLHCGRASASGFAPRPTAHSGRSTTTSG